MPDSFRAFRPWFWAAVVYNVTWGVSVIAYPRWLLWAAGLDDAAAPLAQSIGMMVAVYSYGYYLLARDPVRFAPFIWVALAGKTFGAVGYVYCALTGVLAWRFGVTTVMNDIIWLPAFWAFALRHARWRPA